MEVAPSVHSVGLFTKVPRMYIVKSTKLKVISVVKVMKLPMQEYTSRPTDNESAVMAD